MKPSTTWQRPPNINYPSWFVDEIAKLCPGLGNGDRLAQLLWQRGINDPKTLAGFLLPEHYIPASPFEFAEEMDWAIERIHEARTQGEKVAIWGDFDADGVTSTSVLLDGLGQFFTKSDLIYYIPNRLTESHGLNCAGIERLIQEKIDLIITCDTGSTNLVEIELANDLGIDIIITDHHTLPDRRPPVTAIINPRYLPPDHPLFHLSGVAVAYKLIEALYQHFPEIPQAPLEELLDLVAIGLIADLVQLKGDCRYLAQRGIERLYQDFQRPSEERRRPGIGRLLELCRKTGDRPTDISFGIGPRINAVSRIYGDASFCVDLLTNQDLETCDRLAENAELANTRRKEIQQTVVKDVIEQVSQLDLSTTQAIILERPEWPVGVLGLVAAQIAQEYHKPTILLSTEQSDEFIKTGPIFAKGSARSIANLDLYELVKSQSHLLHRFGGHPFAAGLSLLIENLPLFTEGINQQLNRTLGSEHNQPTLKIDLELTVADLGKELFQELSKLEPCGMGNSVPRILIKNCKFFDVNNANIKDSQGKKIKYIKTNFILKDETSNDGIPGLWWGHYKDDIPPEKCHVVVELDYNNYQNYHVRIVDLISAEKSGLFSEHQPFISILDWRPPKENEESAIASSNPLIITDNPVSWKEVQTWFQQASEWETNVAIAYPSISPQNPIKIWETLVGIAKYLNRTQQTITHHLLLDKLHLSHHSLSLGLSALSDLGFILDSQDRELKIGYNEEHQCSTSDAIYRFIAAVEEEQFRHQYFSEVPLETLQEIAQTWDNRGS